VVGVDQSAAMLKAARRRVSGRGNVELRQGSLEDLPLEDTSCDAALLLLALTYVPEPAVVVGEMARVLRPGGRAVVVDLLRHDREDFRREMGQQSLGFTPGDLREMLDEAGFGGAASRELAPEAQAKGPALVLASASAPARSCPMNVVERKGERAR